MRQKALEFIIFHTIFTYVLGYWYLVAFPLGKCWSCDYLMPYLLRGSERTRLGFITNRRYELWKSPEVPDSPVQTLFFPLCTYRGRTLLLGVQGWEDTDNSFIFLTNIGRSHILHCQEHEKVLSLPLKGAGLRAESETYWEMVSMCFIKFNDSFL